MFLYFGNLYQKLKTFKFLLLTKWRTYLSILAYFIWYYQNYYFGRANWDVYEMETEMETKKFFVISREKFPLAWAMKEIRGLHSHGHGEQRNPRWWWY